MNIEVVFNALVISPMFGRKTPPANLMMFIDLRHQENISTIRAGRLDIAINGLFQASINRWRFLFVDGWSLPHVRIHLQAHVHI